MGRGDRSQGRQRLLYGLRRKRAPRPRPRYKPSLEEALKAVVAESQAARVTPSRWRFSLPEMMADAVVYEVPGAEVVLDCDLRVDELAGLATAKPRLYRHLVSVARSLPGLAIELRVSPSDWPVMADHLPIDQAQLVGYSYDEQRQEPELIAAYLGPDLGRSLPQALASEKGQEAFAAQLHSHPEGVRITFPLASLFLED